MSWTFRKLFSVPSGRIDVLISGQFMVLGKLSPFLAIQKYLVRLFGIPRQSMGFSKYSWKWNPAAFRTATNCSCASDSSNPFTFSMRILCNELSWRIMLEQMAKKPWLRLSSMSNFLPCRVNGWHGGDIRIVFISSFSSSAVVSDCMFRFHTGVSGWFNWYTALAASFISTAPTIRNFVPETGNNRLIWLLGHTHRCWLTFQCSVHAADPAKELQNVPMSHGVNLFWSPDDVEMVRVFAEWWTSRPTTHYRERLR